jgi:CHRD domain-containing protein
MQKRAMAMTLAAGLVAVGAACGSDDTTTPPGSKIVHLSAALTPAGELGVNLKGDPTGSGKLTATLDTSTNVFTYDVQFTGLTSNVSLGHIHGPFIPGGTPTSAGVILNFDPAVTGSAPNATFVGLKTATTGSATGTITLNAATQISATVNGDSLRKLLLAGFTYANIHTPQNGGGEIRGQITVDK